MKKIRSDKSLYGASTFFIKDRIVLWAVLNYYAPIRITKGRNISLLPLDEMFDRFGHARFFLKSNPETVFYQIRVRPKDISKTRFKRNLGQIPVNARSFFMP